MRDLLEAPIYQAVPRYKQLTFNHNSQIIMSGGQIAPVSPNDNKRFWPLIIEDEKR